MKLLNLVKPKWKIPIFYILISFSLLLASLHTFAQEKQQVTIKNKTFAYEISKETTAADLETIEKEINAEKVAHLRFSNIKRNANNEIIGITTQFNDERGSSQKKSEYNSQGISPFSVKIHENTQGNKYLEIANNNQPFSSSANTTMPSIADFFNDPSEVGSDFEPNTMMEMMQSMQENMKQQQELILKLVEEHEEVKSK